MTRTAIRRIAYRKDTGGVMGVHITDAARPRVR